MESIWTKINDDLPHYMQKINANRKLKFIKISPIKTAIIGEEFSLIIFIDRFNVDISYAYKNNGKITVLNCDS